MKIDWDEARRDAPVDERLDEGLDLSVEEDLEEAIDRFEFYVGSTLYLSWESVIRDEQDLPLSAAQEEALGHLLDFGDDDGEDILYIDEHPRPPEPWYYPFQRIVGHLLLDLYRTDVDYGDVYIFGWIRLVEALDKYGKDLSLPEGATEPLDVLSPDIRQRLELQGCFEPLNGVGLTTTVDWLDTEPEEQGIFEEFVHRLRRKKESVRALRLNLLSLFKILHLPPVHEDSLHSALSATLGLESDYDLLAEHL